MHTLTNMITDDTRAINYHWVDAIDHDEDKVFQYFNKVIPNWDLKATNKVIERVRIGNDVWVLTQWLADTPEEAFYFYTKKQL